MARNHEVMLFYSFLKLETATSFQHHFWGIRKSQTCRVFEGNVWTRIS